MTALMDTLDTTGSLQDLVVATNNLIRCAGVLVTRVTNQNQTILANSGLRLPAKFASSTPLSHSICQHVVAMDFPLVIDDTITHPLLQSNLAFDELRIAAYLGAPVHARSGKPVGAICALELRQRRWSQADIEAIKCAAKAADDLILRLN